MAMPSSARRRRSSPSSPVGKSAYGHSPALVPRGQTPSEDDALEADLRADAKEQAEHLMLVDLARNDLGRICDFGSIRVSDMHTVEKYSRVMHLVSHVDGNLRSGCDAFDVVRTTFPAGTVSGAPKIRAMEIIDELEPTRRGLYAGAIGYFDAGGDMDLCIAIRMILVQGEAGYIQAGPGLSPIPTRRANIRRP